MQTNSSIGSFDKLPLSTKFQYFQTIANGGIEWTEKAKKYLAIHAVWVDQIVKVNPVLHDEILYEASIETCIQKLPQLRIAKNLKRCQPVCFPLIIHGKFTEKKLINTRAQVLFALDKCQEISSLNK